MPSRHIATHVEHGRIGIVIEHDPRDSYSRSVGPAARKALRLAGVSLRAGDWTGRGSIYEHDWSFADGPNGKCWTTVPFTFDTK